MAAMLDNSRAVVVVLYRLLYAAEVDSTRHDS
jgi:hypothetical protein